MYLFHSSIIRPLLQILRPRTIVEIGTGEAEHTPLLVNFAKEQGATVHSIDTVRPRALTGIEKDAGSSLVFHCGKSLTELERCPNADVVLIDGDHNWYTVFHELRTIERLAKEHGSYPVMILHDTGWPYARRDMYYDPAAIPEEFRQPYAKTGLNPSTTSLKENGFNADLFHATSDGGPHNGVLTALEDFLRDCHTHYTVVHIAGLHGLSIVVPQGTFISHPELRAFLDSLQTGKPIADHLSVMERQRITLLEEMRRKAHEKEKSVETHAPHPEPKNIRPLAREAGSQLSALRQERDELLAEVDRLLSSASWRLSLPLRLVRRMILACRPRAIRDIIRRDVRLLSGRGRALPEPVSAVTAPITVIIRAGESYSLLADTLASIRRQSMRPQRIVVFGSTEQKTAMESLGDMQQHVEWGGAMHPGWLEEWLRKESRPYLLQMQAGDVLHYDYIRHGIRALETDPRAGFAYSDMHVRSTRTTVRMQTSGEREMQTGRGFHPSCIVRREAFVQGCTLTSGEMPALWEAIIDAGWEAVKSRGIIYFRQDPHTAVLSDIPREATLLLALSGRAWMWPITSAFLERQTYPHEHMHLVLLDTSQDPAFSALVTQWIQRCDYASVSYERMHAGRKGIADLPREEMAHELSSTCALLYNTLARRCKTPLACILEDDVIPPDDAYVRLASTLWNGDALSVAGVYRHRLSPRICAWNWSIDGEAVDAPLFESGIHETGGNGFGCLAIRGTTFRNAIFRAGPPYYNYDQDFYHEQVFVRGMTALMDWDCRCTHYVNEHHWVVPA